MNPIYLRPAQAAKLLSVSERCLRDWMRQGRIPFYKPARKVTLLAVADINRAMQEFRVDAIEEGC